MSNDALAQFIEANTLNAESEKTMGTVHLVGGLAQAGIIGGKLTGHIKWSWWTVLLGVPAVLFLSNMAIRGWLKSQE